MATPLGGFIGTTPDGQKGIACRGGPMAESGEQSLASGGGGGGSSFDLLSRIHLDQQLSNSLSEQYELHTPDESVLEPWKYLMGVPGKNVRGMLVDAFNEWLCIPEETVVTIKDIITCLHTASLLVDDIEDNSKMRRGVPVAHQIYGLPSTLNAANYVYVLAMEKCHMLDNRAVMSVTIKELLNLHRGQGQDILWRDSAKCPTEDQYMAMVQDKTGGLFRLAVGLMQAFSADKATDYTPLVNKMALYFQIRDDLVNLMSPEYQKNKSFCEDLTEGKFSFPIIHCIRANPDDNRLLNILKQRTSDMEMKTYAVKLMEEAGSLDYTLVELRKLRDEMHALLEAHGGKGAAMLTKILAKLDAGLELMGSPSLKARKGAAAGGGGSPDGGEGKGAAAGGAAEPTKLTLADSA